MIQMALMGLGNIASRIAQGMQYVQRAELVFVAASCKERAKVFAKKHKIENYGKYEDILMNKDIQLVYIATANFLHYEHVKMCIEHGKHVLCEKPFLANEKEIKEIFTLAKEHNVFVMEAQKTMFTPLQYAVKKIINSGRIGALKMIDASYCGKLDFSGQPKYAWMFDQALGGSLRDVGVYPISFANVHAQSKVKQCHVMKQGKEGYACDFFASIQIQYENGVLATLRSSWDVESENKGILYGELGLIEIVNFWKGTQAKIIIDGEEEHIEVQQNSDFTGEIQHAIDCIEQGLLQSPILGEQQSIEIANILEGSIHHV